MSTVTLQSVIDRVLARGIPSPLSQPSGFGSQLALELADDVMQDIIAERFNFKWNSVTAAPFYTNSLQQDYPQPGITNIGWLETADRQTVNSTTIPPYTIPMTVLRQLAKTTMSYRPVDEICWAYNKNLTTGVWPGAEVAYQNPGATAPIVNNPVTNFVDVNSNILVLTTIGTTGTVKPSLPYLSLDGATVLDGTCIWTVAGPLSQGFRLNPMPSANGQLYLITPAYQATAIPFTTLKQFIAPIPDDQAKTFRRGYQIACKGAAADAQNRKEAKEEYGIWIEELAAIAKQGDRELDAFALLPTTSPVESIWHTLRDPTDPSQPF